MSEITNRGYSQVTVVYPDGNRMEHDEYESSDPKMFGKLVAQLLEDSPKGTRADVLVRVETFVDGVLVQEIRSTHTFTYRGLAA